MMQTKDISNKSKLANLILLWALLSLIDPVSGFGEDFQKEQIFSKTTPARVAVEMAWETYHDGALGGTLHSPKAQTKLEMDLHQSRGLLAEAYDAEDRGDMEKTNILIHKIMQITDRVIEESQVPKK